MKDKNAATLMIDSGVGGLSVLALAHHELPEENFYFFADAANAPYGDKTPDEIRILVHEILKYYEAVQLPLRLLYFGKNFRFRSLVWNRL